MYLIVSEYFDRRLFKRTIWWGKGKNYQICNRQQEPTTRWKEDYAMQVYSCVEKRLDKLPTTMWIDGRAFDLDNSMIIELRGY